MFLTLFSNPILNIIWAIILTPNLENPPTPPGVERVKLRAQFTNLMPVVYSLAIYSPAIY